MDLETIQNLEKLLPFSSASCFSGIRQKVFLKNMAPFYRHILCTKNDEKLQANVVPWMIHL
jgi:hypothetical protein